MSLATSILKSDLIAAFEETTWLGCGTKMGAAFDTYIMSGTVDTNVTGTVIPPPPATVTYIAYGEGSGTIVTTGLLVLQTTISAMLANPSTVWADVGDNIASAVDTDVLTGSVSTSVSGGLTGGGFGAPGCIDTSASYSAFSTALTLAFTSSPMNTSWKLVADYIATAAEIYLKGSIVTTEDSGIVPPNSWSGPGSGSIT